MHKAYNYCSQRNEKQQMYDFVRIDISSVYHCSDISLVRGAAARLLVQQGACTLYWEI